MTLIELAALKDIAPPLNVPPTTLVGVIRFIPGCILSVGNVRLYAIAVLGSFNVTDPPRALFNLIDIYTTVQTDPVGIVTVIPLLIVIGPALVPLYPVAIV